MTIALSVLGASGKMGKRILQLALNDPRFQIVGGASRNATENSLGHLINDKDLYIPHSADPETALTDCDVAIDFSSHEATYRHLEAAVAAKKALVIGTTGHSAEGRRAIEEAAKTIPILFSPNFSFGMACVWKWQLVSVKRSMALAPSISLKRITSIRKISRAGPLCAWRKHRQWENYSRKLQHHVKKKKSSSMPFVPERSSASITLIFESDLNGSSKAHSPFQRCFCPRLADGSKIFSQSSLPGFIL